jgi:uncharacterized protein YecE (DUF72 family)
MKNLYIGTSGYNYRDWKERFYPKGVPQRKWLEYYATHFSTVEINATFYRNFPKSTFEKWAVNVPNNFQFVIKGSRFITHLKRLKNIETELETFLDEVTGLDTKLSIILWQFPKSFIRSEENFARIQRFKEYLPQTIKNAFEFRDDSWFVDDVFDLFSDYNSTIVLNDSGAMEYTEKVVGGYCYIRFHGPTSLYASSYSDDHLEAWATKIQKILKNRSVYCYFNNDISGYAIENSQRLRELLMVR